MAKPAEIAIPLLLFTALASGCSTSSSDDIAVNLAPGDGKFDALAGKGIRIRRITEVTPIAQANRFPSLDKVASVTVNVATDDEAVVSGTAWIFEQASNWPATSLLKLSAVPSPGSKASEMLFMLIDLADSQPLSCRASGSAGAAVNLFRNVAIDPEVRAIYADGKTMTYDQCGLSAGSGFGSGSNVGSNIGSDIGAPGIGLFVLPWTTTGSLEGSFNYYVKASLE
jgi:hypothetical protein